jgi:hypothetical protein
MPASQDFGILYGNHNCEILPATVPPQQQLRLVATRHPRWATQQTGCTCCPRTLSSTVDWSHHASRPPLDSKTSDADLPTQLHPNMQQHQRPSWATRLWSYQICCGWRPYAPPCIRRLGTLTWRPSLCRQASPNNKALSSPLESRRPHHTVVAAAVASASRIDLGWRREKSSLGLGTLVSPWDAPVSPLYTHHNNIKAKTLRKSITHI